MKTYDLIAKISTGSIRHRIVHVADDYTLQKAKEKFACDLGVEIETVKVKVKER